MDPITTVFAGCIVYGGYKLYKFLSSPIYHCFTQNASTLEGTPVYAFQAIKSEDGTLNIDHITSNVILADKPRLVEAIEFALTKYGTCTNVNSFVFYYGEILLVKLIVDSEASTNVIVRLPRTRNSCGSKRFTVITNKQYHFESPISETYDVALNKDGTLDISKHMGLFNYLNIVDELMKKDHTFACVSEIIFTYYNIPIVKINIQGHENMYSSVVMDLA